MILIQNGQVAYYFLKIAKCLQMWGVWPQESVKGTEVILDIENKSS